MYACVPVCVPVCVCVRCASCCAGSDKGGMGLKLIKCNDAMEGELGSVCSNQEPSYTHQQQEKKKQRGSDSETKTSYKGTELKYYGESLTKKNAGTENKCNVVQHFVFFFYFFGQSYSSYFPVLYWDKLYTPWPPLSSIKLHQLTFWCLKYNPTLWSTSK